MQFSKIFTPKFNRYLPDGIKVTTDKLPEGFTQINRFSIN